MVKVIKTLPHSTICKGHHYIGRKWAGFEESPYHNPFHVGKDGNRKEVLLKFVDYWYAPAQLWLRQKALHDIHMHDTLLCWCKPLECHGDIIAGYVNWKVSQSELGMFL